MSLRSKIEEILKKHKVIGRFYPGYAITNDILFLFDQTLKEVVGEMENEGKGNYILTLTRIVRNTLKQDQLARWEKLK